MPTPEEITGVLEKYLLAETALYREVRELSRIQLEQIEQSNSAALLQTISRKQECLGRIEQIEGAAAPYKQMRERTLESWPPALRHRIAGPVRELQSLLGEIVALEEKSRSAIEARTAAAKQPVQTGKAMRNAYAKPRPSPQNPGRSI